MTDSEKNHVARLLKKYRAQQGLAERAYTRYIWHPATAPGNANLKRWEKRQDNMLNIYNQIMEVVGGEKISWD